MGSESEMDAVVGQALVAREIRRYRERAGLSLNALAARVGYSRTYISTSEKPGAGLISANVVKRIDDELGANGALIALHARADADRQALRTAGELRGRVDVARLGYATGSPERRQPAVPPVSSAAVAVAGECLAHRVQADPGEREPVPDSRPSGSDPKGHADELARLQEIDQREGPGSVVPGVEDLLRGIGVDLSASRGADRRVLLRTAARAAEFAGFLQRDLGVEKQCLYWHDRAIEFAQQADDGPMQAYVLLRKAQAAYDRRDAPRMLDLTLAAARFGGALGPGLRAEILQQQARGEAMLGASGDAARQRLDEAFTALSVVGERGLRDEPGQHYSERLLGFQSALCLSEAGRPRDAVVRYREFFSPELSRRDHAYFSILMATSLALSGEPDEAARVACTALPDAVSTASRRSIREARTLAGVLAPWRGRHHVQQLHDALRFADGASAG